MPTLIKLPIAVSGLASWLYMLWVFWIVTP